MLKQVLAEIQNANGKLDMRQLSKKLNISPSALEGMIEFWVKKGKLSLDEFKPDDVPRCSSCSSLWCSPSSDASC